MAYLTNGFARNRKLTVSKGNDSHDFYITDGFTDPSNATDYAALTTSEFQRLPEAEYQIRLQAFIRHVYAQPGLEGLQTDCPDLTQGSVVWNPTMCPVAAQEQTEE